MNEILKIYLYTSYQDNLSINKACLAFKDNKSCYLVFTEVALYIYIYIYIYHIMFLTDEN